MVKNKANLLYIILIICFSILPTFWFTDDKFIAGGDILPQFKPIQDINKCLYIWDSQINSGNPSIDSTVLFPYLFLWGFFSFFISILYVQKLYFFLLFVITGLSSYKLGLYLFKDNDRKNIISFICTFFYMFNPFILINYSLLQNSILQAYAFFPIFLFAYLRYLDEKFSWYNFFLPLIISLTFASSAINPPIYAILVFIILLYVFSNLGKSNLKEYIIKNFSFFIGFCLINLYWIISFFYSVFKSMDHVYADVSINYLEIFSQKAQLINIYRLLGYWNWGQYPDVSPVLAYPTLYNSAPLIISTYIFICVIIAVLLKGDHRRYTKFSMILLVTGLFFSKGINPPLGNIYSYLYNYIPPFFLFRDPPTRFPFLIIISIYILLGILISEISDNFVNNKLRNILIILIALLITINATPFFTNQVIPISDDYIPGFRTSVPLYSFELGQDLALKKLDASTLFLPQNPFYQIHYIWGYFGIDIYEYLFSTRLISLDPNGGYLKSPYSENFLNLFYKDIGLWNHDYNNEFGNYISLLNARFILHRKDLDWTQIGTTNTGSPQIINNFIKINNFSSLYNSYGHLNMVDQYSLANLQTYYDKVNDSALDLYIIADKRFLPHFYTTNKLILMPGDDSTLDQAISACNYDMRSAVYFENQDEINNHNFENNCVMQYLPDRTTKFLFDKNAKGGIDYIKFNISNFKSDINSNKSITFLPVLEFKKINPTKYRIRVHNATTPFTLVFLESFSNGWNVYAENYSREPAENGSLLDYKIQSGNEKDQATRGEVLQFLRNGWITYLGDHKAKNIEHMKWENNREVLNYTEAYSVDFVSKKFQDTIQNDNLPVGNIFETWLMNPIDNKRSHYRANGYANSWFIDPANITENGKGMRNPNGSYDFELVVEFWPQRVLYVGLFISCTLMLACLGYLVIHYHRNSVKRCVDGQRAKKRGLSPRYDDAERK